MGQLVADLPMRSQDNMGDLYVMAYDDEMFTEGNVITVPQVNQAHDKVWEVYHVNSVDDNWEPYAGSSFIPGDVNGDGFLTVADVTALISLVLSGNATVDDNPAADVNGDGNLTVADVTALINLVLGGNATTNKAAASQRASSMHGPSAMIPEEELIMERPNRAALAD